jgi:hypothetical protein
MNDEDALAFVRELFDRDVAMEGLVKAPPQCGPAH